MRCFRACAGSGRVCVASPAEATQNGSFLARFSGDVRVVALPDEDCHARAIAACDVVLCSPSGALSTGMRAPVCRWCICRLPIPLRRKPRDSLQRKALSLNASSYDEAAAQAISLAKTAPGGSACAHARCKNA